MWGGKTVAEAGWGTDMFPGCLVVELEVKSQRVRKANVAWVRRVDLGFRRTVNASSGPDLAGRRERSPSRWNPDHDAGNSGGNDRRLHVPRRSCHAAWLRVIGFSSYVIIQSSRRLLLTADHSVVISLEALFNSPTPTTADVCERPRRERRTHLSHNRKK